MSYEYYCYCFFMRMCFSVIMFRMCLCFWLVCISIVRRRRLRRLRIRVFLSRVVSLGIRCLLIMFVRRRCLLWVFLLYLVWLLFDRLCDVMFIGLRLIRLIMVCVFFFFFFFFFCLSSSSTSSPRPLPGSSSHCSVFLCRMFLMCLPCFTHY